jgi:release factor glutamine methyltransferase
VIVSNPPYIAVDDEHLQHNGLPFEPIDALTDYVDGLSALRLLIQEAPQYLQDGGYLWVEHGYDQAFVVRELFLRHGFVDVVHVKDLAGIDRVTGGIIKHDQSDQKSCVNLLA